LDEKCDKDYSGTDETWLCINVDAAITEIEIIEDFIGNELEIRDNDFDRIYVTVRKPEAEGGGLKVIPIK
jgi:hypothetical protein